MHTLSCWGEAERPRPWMPISASTSWFSTSVNEMSCSCTTDDRITTTQVLRFGEDLKSFEELQGRDLRLENGGCAFKWRLVFVAWNVTAIFLVFEFQRFWVNSCGLETVISGLHEKRIRRDIFGVWHLDCSGSDTWILILVLCYTILICYCM